MASKEDTIKSVMHRLELKIISKTGLTTYSVLEEIWDTGKKEGYEDGKGAFSELSDD